MTPFMIIITGPMGSGKSTIGKLLHKQLKRTALLSTDAVKLLLSDNERGERDNAIHAAVLMGMAKTYIEQGINILLPQAFWKREYIEPYCTLAKEKNMKLFVYQLEGPKEVLVERIKNRVMPAGRTPPSEEHILKNLQTYEENRYELGTVFDVGTLTSEKIAVRIMEEVRGVLPAEAFV
jgi:predicted kinase